MKMLPIRLACGLLYGNIRDMNLQAIAQLVVLALIVALGPLIIVF